MNIFQLKKTHDNGLKLLFAENPEVRIIVVGENTKAADAFLIESILSCLVYWFINKKCMDNCSVAD